MVFLIFFIRFPFFAGWHTGDQTVFLTNTVADSADFMIPKKGLEKKLDALVMRELYTKYKIAPSEEEREKARREYLDRRGVPESFRW